MAGEFELDGPVAAIRLPIVSHDATGVSLGVGVDPASADAPSRADVNAQINAIVADRLDHAGLTSQPLRFELEPYEAVVELTASSAVTADAAVVEQIRETAVDVSAAVRTYVEQGLNRAAPEERVVLLDGLSPRAAQSLSQTKTILLGLALALVLGALAYVIGVVIFHGWTGFWQ